MYILQSTEHPERSIVIRLHEGEIHVSISGFEALPDFNCIVTEGGVSACRTILNYQSEGGSISLSLAVPDGRVACKMLSSWISIKTPVIARSKKEKIEKRSGNDSSLRKMVEKRFGVIEEG